MPFRDEIIMGARLAAVAFAILLGSLIAYRLQQHPVSTLRPPVETQKEAPQPPVLAPPVPTPAEKPVARADANPGVPPPPAPKASARRNPGKAVLAPQRVVKVIEVVPAAEAAPPSAPPIETAAVAVAPGPVADVPETVVARAEDGIKPAPPHDAAAPKAGNSGRRVVKAVGRFLHIRGKKDAEPQTAR
jgi:hypothetical protein